MSSSDSLVDTLRNLFRPIVGASLQSYWTAELFLESSGAWEPWNDLPIRLCFQPDITVSLSWSKFDALDARLGATVPDWVQEQTTTFRWVEQQPSYLRAAIGRRLCSVALVFAPATFGSRTVLMRNGVLLNFEGIQLEVFNALDENGYAIHTERPPGDVVACA